MKKLLSILISALIVLSCVPLEALSAPQDEVVSVSADPVSIIEGTRIYFCEFTDDQSEWHYWFRFDAKPDRIVVTLKSGETVEGSFDELLHERGFDVFYSDDQTYENRWDIGMHSAKVSVNGVECTYAVEI
ncbi:MAG: hypothetical protein IKN38_01775, partial [Clostridia bacterium]|nr:hypothetical protein [Clostridia bacterium]